MAQRSWGLCVYGARCRQQWGTWGTGSTSVPLPWWCVIGLSCLCHVQQVLSPCIWGQGCLIPHCCAGLLITQTRVWPAPYSCDNPHLLQKDDRVLWHRAWGWGHQKQSTIQPYNHGDFPKLHAHICYRLSKLKNLLNLWSSQKKQLAETQISFACPITQLISFPVCWFTLTVGMSTLPHAAPLLTGTELCLLL